VVYPWERINLGKELLAQREKEDRQEQEALDQAVLMGDEKAIRYKKKQKRNRILNKIALPITLAVAIPFLVYDIGYISGIITHPLDRKKSEVIYNETVQCGSVYVQLHETENITSMFVNATNDFSYPEIIAHDKKDTEILFDNIYITRNPMDVILKHHTTNEALEKLYECAINQLEEK